MKVFQIKDPLYGQSIIAIVGCSHDKLEQYIKQKYGVTIESTLAVGETFSLENKDKKEKRFFIWAEDFNWTISQQGVVAHELMHLTFSVLEYVGLEKSDESEEAFTYFFEEIMCIAWRKLLRLYPPQHAKIHKSKGLRQKGKLRNRRKKGHARGKAKV